MGALTEYLELKDETCHLKEEVSRVMTDRKRTTSEKREIVESLQKRLRLKKQRIRILHDKVVAYYLFPGLLIIVAALAFRFSESFREILIEILMKFI
ncbi:conserved hypothetical protein [Methanococcus maripaludis C5]|uniref:Uncharacterized protein n=1 Tax=Methanococcus maripaludis (strain C5 / ATCC BAA-1333) TaxID=402880 RepID=A4FYR6_METM5|nr:hypothetical protein [Methanococcus maripaludis]ABO35350.1 conserved hypothetical protein [Methanococcus maripaludis C5]